MTTTPPASTPDHDPRVRFPLTIPEVVADLGHRLPDYSPLALPVTPPADDAVQPSTRDVLDAALRLYVAAARGLLIAAALDTLDKTPQHLPAKERARVHVFFARVGAMFGERGDEEDVLRPWVTQAELALLRMIRNAPQGKLAEEAIAAFLAGDAEDVAA